MAKGSGGGSSSTTQEIPSELKPLYTQTGELIQQVQNEAPISQFIQPNPTEIAPLSGTQQTSLDLLNQNLRSATGPLEEAPIVGAGRRYFESEIAPGIENRATLSGLGRSTALENARASAEATTILPLLQREQARRDAMIAEGFRGGDIERSVEQQESNAAAQDFLRRQALSEQALFGPMSQLPSTFGQSGKTSTTGGGGLFK